MTHIECISSQMMPYYMLANLQIILPYIINHLQSTKFCLEIPQIKSLTHPRQIMRNHLRAMDSSTLIWNFMIGTLNQEVNISIVLYGSIHSSVKKEIPQTIIQTFPNNRSTVKVSYCCIQNILNIIKSHSNRVVNSKRKIHKEFHYTTTKRRSSAH